MPTCAQCQGQVNIEDKICPHCGYKFVKSPWERWYARLKNALKRNKYTVSSGLLGFIAVGCCLLAIGIGYFPFISYRQQPVEIAVRIRLLGGGLGILAVLFAVVGLARTESRRLALSGIVLGSSAIFLKYAIIILIIAGIFIFLLRDYI